MSIRKPLIGFSLFAVVSLILTFLVWNTLARPIAGHTQKYQAVFTNVLGLREGDDVRIAGVRVGKVDAITLANGNKALVRFEIQSDQNIYGNTKAMVRYQNLIGQRYVALAPTDKGNPAPLRPGATIPLERTEPSFDISLLLNGFQPLFQVLQPDQINRLSETLILALQGDRISISSFITQAATLGADFQRRDAILTDLITGLSGVMQGLAKRGDELETLINQTRNLVTGLYQQGQSLQASTVQIADGTSKLVNMLGTVQPKLVTVQNSTRDALTLLLANGAKLDRAAVDLPGLLADAGSAGSEGAYAKTYICRLDVSLYGVLLPRGIFSQIGGNSQSAVCRP